MEIGTAIVADENLMKSVTVHKTSWRTTRDRSTTLSPKTERGILQIIQKDLVPARKHSPKNGEVEEILTKEYQYKNSYQSKYCNPKNIYGPWYLKSYPNINLFDENNN